MNNIKFQEASARLQLDARSEQVDARPKQPYTLFTDASHAYLRVLTQAVESPENLRPVAFTSGSFLEMHHMWSATEREAYAAYQSILV